MTAYLISICRSVSDRKRLEDYWAAFELILVDGKLTPAADRMPDTR